MSDSGALSCQQVRMQASREGHVSSSWLRQYIRDHGGVMNVSTRTVILG